MNLQKIWDNFFKKWKIYFILNLGYESDYEGDVEVLGSDDEQYKPGLSASSEGKIFSNCSNWLMYICFQKY